MNSHMASFVLLEDSRIKILMKTDFWNFVLIMGCWWIILDSNTKRYIKLLLKLKEELQRVLLTILSTVMK